MSGARPSRSPASLRRRAHILDVARELIAERGLDKLVVADVAEHAEVSVATIYNLVGTRDRLLFALLDDVADRVRHRLEAGPVVAGVAGCVAVIDAACLAVLDDPITVRAVLSSVGVNAPDQWLDDGLEGAIKQQVMGAFDVGEVAAPSSVDTLTHHIQLGFRGALISWVFGLIDDHQLATDAEAMALHVLASAAVPAERKKIQIRLDDLASSSSSARTPEPKDAS